MNAEEIREYCLLKKGVTEGFPFGEDVLVFKIMGKMFALLPIESKPLRINLKMSPELIDEYREKYTGVHEGYHMNKKHWNTVFTEESDVPNSQLRWMIDHSYEMVKAGLKKQELQMLEKMDKSS